MTTVPVPRSAQQIISDMLDAFLSKQGLNSIRVGSGILSVFEAAGQSDFRSSTDTFQALNATDLSEAEGVLLDNIGNSENIPRITLSPAIGSVNITDTSFTKISSTLAANQPAPIVGTTTLNVANASSFPNSGNIYIGRGTVDYEGPIAYTSKANIGVNWTLTLSTGTTKFHNTSETVVLAQGGNRLVTAGTTINTPLAGISNSASYSTLYSQTLADGENQLLNVLVVCKQPGTIGNCIAGSITVFANVPFTGAAVTNPSPISTGVDTELDDDYRERIENIRASRTLGTILALETAVIGVSDGISRITSSSFVRNFGRASTLYIDDGTGYEMTTASVPIESLVDSAVGGEDHFQTTQRPVAQAFVITQNTAPFNLKSTDVLSVTVGGTNYIHSFNEGIFSSISNASAYEVVASINSDSNIGFMARTANAGSNVVIFSKTDTNDDIQVNTVDTSTGNTDANIALGFTLGNNSTLQLFKNDRLLFKDGLSAIFVGNSFSQWANMSGPQTLTIAIDNTPAVTYTFTDQDFINASTKYVTLAKNSLAAWVSILNSRIPGITASINNNALVLTSNIGPNERASVIISGGTLVTVGMFSTGTFNGIQNDYSLDRNNGEIYLNVALNPNDKLSIGTSQTRAFIQSGVISTNTLSANATLWFAVDSNAEIIQNGISTTVPIAIAVSAIRPWGHLLTLTASVGTPFNNVLPGDWVILWDSNLDPSIIGTYKVVAATGSVITIERKDMTGVRAGHRSVALQTTGSAISSVLTCGGNTIPVTTFTLNTLPTNSAGIYNPNTKLSSAVKAMVSPRAYHTATLLSNGKVLVVGGIGPGGTPLNTIEIYDPVGDSWTSSGATLISGVYNHQATLLGNGTVLITGGMLTSTTSTNAFYVYTPGSDTITTTGTLTTNRGSHKQVLLPSGDVLIVGGLNNTTPLSSCEIFNHSTLTSSGTGAMDTARYDFGLAAIGSSPTTIMAAGNHYGISGNTTYEIYTIGAGTWAASSALPNSTVFENKDLNTLPNGVVVGLYGYNSGTPTTFEGFYYNGSFTAITADSLWTDSSAKWDNQTVPIADGISVVKNRLVVLGGLYQQSTAFGFAPTASVEEWDYTTVTWTVPDPAVNASVDLTGDGIAFARTTNYLQEVVVPAATNYTASSFVTSINSSLIGATAYVYLTNQLRVSTNTYAAQGSIALLVQTANASTIELNNTSSIDNLLNHVGSVQSGSSLGTPTFNDNRVVGTIENGGLSVTSASTLTPDRSIVGLRSWMTGVDTSTVYHPTAVANPRSGNNQGFTSKLLNATNYTLSADVTLRSTPNVPFNPTDRVYFASPFAIGPNDVLNVIVDNDITKQFSINMYRKLNTINNTYGTTNTFKDGTAGGLSLAATFGLGFNFNDFAVYMPARGLAFSADSTRKMLFRYYRLGADGNDAQVRFGNPTGPSQALAVNISQSTTPPLTDVTIKLQSGSLRTPTTHNTTQVGQAVLSIGGVASVMEILNLAVSAASRTSDVTTLTLTLPSGTLSDHGLNVGNLVWVNSTNPSFASGPKAITVRTATTISYAEINSNATGTNIGDVSFDTLGEATFTGSSTVVSDWFRFNDPLNSPLSNMTFYITAVDSNGRNVTVSTGDQANPSSLTVNSTINWYPISVSTNLQTFANTSQTAATVVGEINALAAANNSTCPITATELGDGTGTITQGTADTLNSYTAWYQLSDGINWVQTTTSPGSTSGDYSLTFKNPINGTLATAADWQDETVYLVPSTAQNVVDWLNAPTVTGLSTVANIQTSNDGNNVQLSTLTIGSSGGIQVQGGGVNNATATIIGTSVDIVEAEYSFSTVSNSDAKNFTAGMWCKITNGTLAPLFPWSTGFGITSWTADGQIIFNQPIAFRTINRTQAKMQFEKQGNFVAVSDMGLSGSMSWDIFAGMWLRISAPTSPTLPAVSAGNEGIFRIVRIDSSINGSNGTIWIENADVIEEQSECVIEAFSEPSVMPGDSFVILDPVFGANNLGVWTVTNVGTTTATSNDPFNNLISFVVDVSTRIPQVQGTTPTLTSANENLVYKLEAVPGVFVRNILGISPNTTNGAYTDIKFDQASIGSGGITTGSIYNSIITALDKLNFPLNFYNGTDGYDYATGLVGAANTVIYGDPADPITYPGVAAADAKVNISGPVVKRIQISLAARVKTGVTLADIEARIKSAVATTINQNPVGTSLAFSVIIAAVEKVVGVVSVVIISPVYNSVNDEIAVQSQEKTKVLNLDDDIQVSFLGI